MKKRILSFLLVVAMVVAMVPATMIAAFAEDSSSDRVMTLVGQATLDGKNTNGEYDAATKVMLNAYDNDTDGDNMRIVYTDEAIYVLVEVFDDTPVTYKQGGSSKSDYVYLGFGVGTSYMGVKRFYRNTDEGALSFRDVMQPAGTGVDMKAGYETGKNEDEYFAIVDNGTTGFTMEARFPVDKMSEYEQELYAAGQLELHFTAGAQDGVDNAGNITTTYDGDTENSDWDGKAGDTDSFAYGTSYKVKNPSVYPEYDFEFVSDEVIEAPANNMAYAGGATLDGANTGGEYDGADEIAIDKSLTGTVYYGATALLSKSVNGDAVPEGSYYKVIYTADAIYVFANISDTTNVPYSTGYNNADQTELYFSIGDSFKGYQFFFRHTPMTAVNTGSGVASYKVVDNGESGYTIEAQFPVSQLSTDDQAAYAAKTLDVKFSVRVGDNTGSAITAFYSDNATAGGFRGATDRTNVLSYDYTAFKFGEIEIAYVSSPTFDGVNTVGEYDNTYTKNFGLLYGAGDLTANLKAVYSDDGIYFLLQINDTTDNGGGDFAWIHFGIGTSIMGSVQFARNGSVSNINNLDATALESSDVKISSNATGWSVEVKIPVTKLNATDAAALADGTLSIVAEGLASNNYSTNGAFYSYAGASGTVTADLLASYPKYTLLAKDAVEDNTAVSKLTGANLTLGENINVNYYAYIPASKVANSYVKFTYNGKTTIVRPVADKPGSYVFTFEGLAPHMLGDEINAELVVATKSVATKDDYSALQNCKDLLAADGTTDAAKQLIYDLLAYGAASQNYLGYKTDALVNDGYENLASEYSRFADSATYDGMDTDGEYDSADEIAIGTSLVGTVYYGSGSPLSMAVSGNPAPEGSYYKVLFAEDAIYVFANVADTTNVPYDTAWNNSDQTELYFSIGESFKGYQFFFRHGAMTIVNSGTGNLGDYGFSKVVDNGESGYTIEAKFPVANMTESEQEAYKAGTLDVKFSVRVGDNTGSAITAFYSDNANATGFRGASDRTNVLSYDYTAFKIIDKAVGAPNLAAAYFAAAGVYHANTNKVYAKIALAYGESVENLTVTINGAEAVIEATDAESVYIVYTDDISVTDFDKVFNFVLSDGANTQTLTYSVNAYAHVKANNANTDAMATLAKAMYCYGVSAEAYAAQNN